MDNTGVPWPLIAALIAGLILIFTKMFDYFDNKPAKDLKLLIDIQKGLSDTNQDKNLIRRTEKLTNDSLVNFLEIKENKNSLQIKYPKRYSLYLKCLWVGTGLIFISIIAFIISMFAKLANPQLSDGALALGIWCGIGFMACYAITSVLDRVFKI